VTVGGSLALIIIGAILTYAVNYRVSGVDIKVVGVILMIGGLVGLIIGLIRIATARRPGPRPPGTHEERHDDEPSPYDDPTRRRGH
jgi:Domain of unknown function (DUF6458)